MSLFKLVALTLLTGVFFVILIHHLRDYSNKNEISLRTIISQKNLQGQHNSVQISHESVSIHEGPETDTLHYSGTNWSPIRAATCKEDLQHIKDIENTNVETTSTQQLADILFKSVTRPVQMGCNKMTRLGMGSWASAEMGWDGHKYVCEDDFTGEEGCLVYTFGVNVDASFEEAMASIGCEVYAHDHTVKKFPITNYKSIHYVKLGIGASNNDALNLRTLNTLLMHNGHSQRTINYLKVDVEGAECESMMQWFESGSLANVRQIGIEFHEVWRNIRQYFTVVKELYKLGFVTIMWDENRVATNMNYYWGQKLGLVLLETAGLKDQGTRVFEVVFRRFNLTDCAV